MLVPQYTSTVYKTVFLLFVPVISISIHQRQFKYQHFTAEQMQATPFHHISLGTRFNIILSFTLRSFKTYLRFYFPTPKLSYKFIIFPMHAT